MKFYYVTQVLKRGINIKTMRLNLKLKFRFQEFSKFILLMQGRRFICSNVFFLFTSKFESQPRRFSFTSSVNAIGMSI